MSTLHPLYPPTHLLSTNFAPTAAETHEFLHSFIHWTSATRTVRNGRHPYNTLAIMPFPHSVLNNLRRIEMGLQGVQAPRVVVARWKKTARGRRYALRDDGDGNNNGTVADTVMDDGMDGATSAAGAVAAAAAAAVVVVVGAAAQGAQVGTKRKRSQDGEAELEEVEVTEEIGGGGARKVGVGMEGDGANGEEVRDKEKDKAREAKEAKKARKEEKARKKEEKRARREEKRRRRISAEEQGMENIGNRHGEEGEEEQED